MPQYAPVIDLATLNGSNGFRIEGIDAGDQSGFPVASAGDVNGDGFADILIGAAGGDPGGDANAGESYVVFGQASGFAAALDLSTLNGTNGFRLDGIDVGDASGFSVASPGDVNGDGFDDIIIGAYGAGGSDGESYVVFGKASGFAAALDLSTLNGTNGFRLDGIDTGDESGFSVSSAGDINGDGFDDILIGAPGGDRAGPYGFSSGESYVVFGQATGFAAALDLSTLNGSNGFRLDGIGMGYQDGHAVSSAGDVNGDGFDDILIGGIRAYAGYGAYVAAHSHVVFGKASGFAAALDLSTLDGADGFRVGLYSNLSVASAGDVNGDGFDDLIVGAFDYDPGGDSGAGESYVVFGKASGFAADFDLSTLNGTNGFRLDGIDTHDYSGVSVASAGDFNGDGFDDILIGALGGDPGGDSAAGESYVVFGKASGFAAALDLAMLDGNNGFRLDGIDASDFSGRSVSSAGDVNGDGFDDILIGAWGGDPNGDADAGESYVIFGSRPGEAVTRTGTAIANTIFGSNFIDTLNGLDGDDILNGGAGADILNGDAGNDTASYAGAGGAVQVDLGANTAAGSDAAGDTLNSISHLTGSSHDDTLTGSSAANILNGGLGADILNGVAGNDTASYAGAGGAVQVNLGANTAAGSDAAGDTLNFITHLTGSSHNDTLTGDSAGNILDGGAGADAMDGGDGADLYIVDHVGDVTTEASALGGADLVRSSVTRTLDVHLENLTLTGSAAINGTGNALGNIMIGNSAANTLSGLGGADDMRGGGGNDTYIVNSTTDMTTETSATGGTDLVRSAVTRTLGANFENLTLTGSSAINGTGNALANILNGNAFANVLSGADGADKLVGFNGGDTLRGGLGLDRLTGGNGADKFVFDVAPAFANRDVITDFNLVGDVIQLENSVFAALGAAGALAAAAFRVGANAGDASDRIIYHSASGRLYFDADGTGAGAQIHFATLDAGLALTAADFTVI